MTTRKIAPPTLRGGQRVRERWEEEISTIADNSSFTIDELSQLFQTLLRDKNSEMEYRIGQLERKLNALQKLDDVEKKQDDLGRLTWLLHQRNS